MLSFLRLCRFSWSETAKQLTSVYTRVVYVWKWCNLQRRKYVQNKHVNKSTNWFSFMSTLRPSTELSLFVICVWCFLTADLFSSERCIAINMGIFGSFALLFFFFFFKKTHSFSLYFHSFIHLLLCRHSLFHAEQIIINAKVNVQDIYASVRSFEIFIIYMLNCIERADDENRVVWWNISFSWASNPAEFSAWTQYQFGIFSPLDKPKKNGGIIFIVFTIIDGGKIVAQRIWWSSH